MKLRHTLIVLLTGINVRIVVKHSYLKILRQIFKHIRRTRRTTAMQKQSRHVALFLVFFYNALQHFLIIYFLHSCRSLFAKKSCLTHSRRGWRPRQPIPIVPAPLQYHTILYSIAHFRKFRNRSDLHLELICTVRAFHSMFTLYLWKP